MYVYVFNDTQNLFFPLHVNCYPWYIRSGKIIASSALFFKAKNYLVWIHLFVGYSFVNLIGLNLLYIYNQKKKNILPIKFFWTAFLSLSFYYGHQHFLNFVVLKTKSNKRENKKQLNPMISRTFCLHLNDFVNVCQCLLVFA